MSTAQFNSRFRALALCAGSPRGYTFTSYQLGRGVVTWLMETEEAAAVMAAGAWQSESSFKRYDAAQHERASHVVLAALAKEEGAGASSE